MVEESDERYLEEITHKKITLHSVGGADDEHEGERVVHASNGLGGALAPMVCHYRISENSVTIYSRKRLLLG